MRQVQKMLVQRATAYLHELGCRCRLRRRCLAHIRECRRDGCRCESGAGALWRRLQCRQLLGPIAPAAEPVAVVIRLRLREDRVDARVVVVRLSTAFANHAVALRLSAHDTAIFLLELLFLLLEEFSTERESFVKFSLLLDGIYPAATNAVQLFWRPLVVFPCRE